MSRIARPLAILAIAVGLTTAVRGEEKCAADANSEFPAQARDAVRQYATDGGRLEYRGISATRLDGSNYMAVVDFGDGRDLMLLLVRRFVDDKGGSYWKASALDPNTAALFGGQIKDH